ncbi:hypothetical protein DL770_006712 [Monosporascus sp. CRB-9-2]|nr:hypothetical protein DL770_006712 [Monosporascus sp. CRB-9-2]
MTQLRQVNIITFPVKSDSCTADWRWTSEDRRYLFGIDPVVLVDLRDECGGRLGRERPVDPSNAEQIARDPAHVHDSKSGRDPP